ncbi:MAG: MerR family transcriptional regulator, partial [Clostridia bacterium]|nr:MerR family transcriptional regulator [Clostridia bacterium]
MHIKEAAALCGLTEKAIRLYEEKGLITPTLTEKNGRMFRDYDENTVAALKTVAALRRAFFSLEQIAEM